MAMESIENHSQIIVDIHNQRIKVMEYDSTQIDAIAKTCKQQADKLGMTKLIVYARHEDLSAWSTHGFIREGILEGCIQGQNAHMLRYFVTSERGTPKNEPLADEIMQISLAKQADSSVLKALPDDCSVRWAKLQDAEELANLYQVVFETYPTPMHDPEYVRNTMQANTHYAVVEVGGRIVCAASAEVTPNWGSAEMTDCATHPDWLGKGLLQHLFVALEQHMQEMGIYYLYTITRAHSAAMNVTAAKMGYRYTGRLINNCVISTGFEDMNIWVKPLRAVWD
ncbi:putative beta-lysine N-acetyltransferase [Brevibacillus laterosporus]|uniref:Beta-lysine N-acetyltransferase n=1 Tax=Brevibacillus laterosporus TaxID=1465 RepID=A0AAP3DLA2_BRELA|nr:putative beta-lysine N-acetyltransferase [Brevibacillus laterosporus]MCR8982750.1 putative beta-lysine N-acetyltransferase [Brevibacillus laterosporus]MCZ0809906.1 putative beta-lysine N-acetyltransferase [Brevibacillus laterosporus]MCZ0828442.1 putative beta-lysine N-acetyltransferase [Brevibacillus laterosporus]MCZ0852513.1 putative beta-lysine N-acetyltransferase [Brevibacillus laterosporus]